MKHKQIIRNKNRELLNQKKVLKEIARIKHGDREGWKILIRGKI